jgi:alpha-D-ribose 1-methylphosphonate 5-triphosphate diphosphatase PhnM
MRTKLVSIAIVLVITLSFCLATLYVMHDVIDQAEDLTVQIIDHAEHSRLDMTEEKMIELTNLWERHRPFLEMLISHDDMHAVIERYVEATVSLKGEDLDDFYISMALLQEMLRHIREQEEVAWGNVF